jgi:hypothetical protein
MIFPTYRGLGTNGELVKALGVRYSNVNIREFALGGLIVVLATRGHAQAS